MSQAINWSVAFGSVELIDDYNILNATIMTMHKAIDLINPKPEHIIVDGNKFKNYKGIPHTTVIKGDATYYSIAAASIIAKYTRDQHMLSLDKKFPGYDWANNVGYATQKHRDAIKTLGPNEHHRKTFIGNVLMEMDASKRKLF